MISETDRMREVMCAEGGWRGYPPSEASRVSGCASTVPGVRGAPALPGGVGGGHGAPALPVRKLMDHRGPLSIDVSGAWYFITICAEGHRSWVATKWPSGGDVVRSASGDGRAGAPRTPTGVPSFDEIADVILQHAREYHQMGKWKISLFLVMPDHLHFIMHVPNVGGGVRGAPALPGGESGVRGAPALPGGESGVRGVPALPRVIANWKHWLTARYGIAFQANFWDTRLRDETHYADKFRYVCNNPVRKGLCASAREWRPVIAFDRESGEERGHR